MSELLGEVGSLSPSDQEEEQLLAAWRTLGADVRAAILLLVPQFAGAGGGRDS